MGVGGALFLALRPQHQTTGSELYSTSNRMTPDGLANLPRDYTGLPKAVPQLGPPLPGDLGRPIAKAGAPAPGMPASGPDPAQQRIAQEQEAARPSHLFATTNVRQTSPTAIQPSTGIQVPTAAAAGSGDLTSQDHKLAFLNGNIDRRTVSPDRVDAPASPYVLQAGAVIPAALMTGVRSDLPGQVTAQVTEESMTVRPARSSDPAGRALGRPVRRPDRIWPVACPSRLEPPIMPNGRSIVLERQPGADPEGYAGLEDEVDNHWGMLFKAAVLSTLLSVGSEAGTSNNENSLVQAIRQGASQSFNQVGEQVVGRSLNVQPTITIRPGFPVRALVTHDLVLEPYRRKREDDGQIETRQNRRR